MNMLTMDAESKSNAAAPKKRRGTVVKTIRENGSLHVFHQRKVEKLLAHLGRAKGDHPVVFVGSDSGPVLIQYSKSHKILRFSIVPESLRVVFKARLIDSLIAPSFFEALIFLAEIEVLRQGVEYPSIRIASREEYLELLRDYPDLLQ